MISFRQFLSEENEHHLPVHGFIHDSGKIIGIRKGPHDLIAPDHSEYVVKNPHVFGMSDEDVKKHAGSAYEKIIQGRGAESVPLKAHMGNMGYSTYYRYSNTDTSSTGEKITHHTINIDTFGRKEPAEYFIPHVKSLVPHVSGIRGRNSFQIVINGIKERPNYTLGSLREVNEFINQTKVSETTPTPIQVTSQDIRQRLTSKPESMSQAEWNSYRTIGDSFNYGIFKEKI
jgi:hypothetical protein